MLNTNKRGFDKGRPISSVCECVFLFDIHVSLG